MGLIKALNPSTSSRIDGPFMRGRAVGESRDLRRILALPVREKPSDAEIVEMSRNLKSEFGTHAVDCECANKFKRRCCSDLLPVQAWALHEMRVAGGLLGPIGVGHGKTLLDLLTAMVVPNCKTAVLLLPSNLRRQLVDVDWAFYGQHWKLPNLAGGRWIVPGRPTLHVVAFSELSGSKATDLLSRIRPDIIIADEAHSVRHRTAARTKRFLRYFSENPAARLFCWSGTLTSRSLKDYAHLSNLALRENSPTPLHQPTVEEWAGHLDSSEFRSPPGRLSQFGADTRAGFRARVLGTLGVVSSGDSNACEASLIISAREFEASETIKKHIKELEATWQRPDGEELIDAMSVGRCARELSCGFYYQWIWPRREPIEVIEKWLRIRKEWHKELREKLKLSRPHMDSPLLCSRAAIRWYNGYTHIKCDESGREIARQEIPPKSKEGPLPVWPSLCWPEWKAVRKSAKPETKAVWLDESFVSNCLDWLKEPGLLWYEYKGLAQKLLELAAARKQEVLFAGPGAEGDLAVLNLPANASVIISSNAHGEGKNLQQFNRNLLANPPSSGGEWEQIIGRTVRAGQEADEVTVETFLHTEPFGRAVEKARELSNYIEGTFGAAQKLASKATWLF